MDSRGAIVRQEIGIRPWASRQLPSEVDSPSHVGFVGHGHDKRWPAVDPAHEDLPVIVMVWKAGLDNASFDLWLELLDGYHATHDGSRPGNPSAPASRSG